MSDNKQFNDLNEKTQQIKIALKYTGDDVNKAKLMVNGQLNDVVVAKGKFSVGNGIYGALLIFFNSEQKYIMNLNSILSPAKKLHDKVAVNDGWRFFYSNLKDYVNSQSATELSSMNSYDFTRHLLESLRGYDMFDYIIEHNIEAVSDILTEIVSKYHNREQTQLQLDFETTSSLVLENADIPLENPDDSESNDDVKAEMTDEDALIAKIEKEADHIVDGRVIVAPVKGKYIKDIAQGDKIKALLVNENDSVAMSVASVQKAISQDGEMLPVKARVKAKIPLREGGFIIYGVVAKNILVTDS